MIVRYLATAVKNKKPSHPFQGKSVILNRPVAFRPCFTAGLALSLYVVENKTPF